MIILFDEAEQDFTSLGLGILRDAISCTVEEKLNDTFELSMTYPTNGLNYTKLRIGRIIYAKPNPYDNQQPFRIYSISRPMSGTVTVSAQHISYDMNGIPCKAVDATGLNDALSQIQNGAYIKHHFTLATNISSAITFKTTTPYNMRALLMGDDEESLLGVYDGEVKFDKFTATIYSKRGRNRGAQVSYGYNMTDLTHETNTDLLYNGVFPYYHKETTSSETTTEDTFAQVYIVGETAFTKGWLSYTKGGEAYEPLDATPVQIATEGDYYQKVYTWDTVYQKFVERLYNQTVTLVEGVTSPTWISIDWKTFPTITCRANAVGYFKLSTDDSWGDQKGVGDVIFEGNILSTGLTEITSNLILYYSEVIPTGANSTNKEVTEVTEVFLDDPIIKLSTTDATAMKYDRILNLDLTSEFDEEPSKDQLKAKATEYISKHKVGTVKHNTTVSFIDLETTTEADKYKNFDHIELGDTVRVLYKDLGVDVQLRAITTTFDAIANKYSTVELGEKEDSLSSESIQNGDSISSLSNDVGYTDVTTVNKLIAKTVTAEYIQAINAKLSQAQIEELTAAKIKCTGIVEATQFTLDELIAKLLTAENAKISNTLEAGVLKVAGDITINSGKISISGDDGTTFSVDREGNMKGNSVEITGGTLKINDGAFEVTNEGVLTATAGRIGNCTIDEDGTLVVPAANIEGSITAKSIKILDDNGDTVVDMDAGSPSDTTIGGFTVDSKSIRNGATKFDVTDDEPEEGVYIGVDGIRLGKKFYVDASGEVTATSLRVITSVKTTYCKSNDGTYAPLTGWVEDPNECKNGHYLWTRVTTYYSSTTASGTPESYSTTTVTLIRAAKQFIATVEFSTAGKIEYNSTNIANYEVNDTFTQAYIVGETPFEHDWLSHTANGEPYEPTDATPVQIATEGDYYQKVYTWDFTTKKYIEKLYNESVALSSGATVPEWLTVEWPTSTTVRCLANAEGYFKLSTDDNWGEKKSIGDVVFAGTADEDTLNTIIYYSAVIPSGPKIIPEASYDTIVDTTGNVYDIKSYNESDSIIYYSLQPILSLKGDKGEQGEPGADGVSAYAYSYSLRFDIASILFKTTNNYSDYNNFCQQLYNAGFTKESFISDGTFYSYPIIGIETNYQGIVIEETRLPLPSGLYFSIYSMLFVKSHATTDTHTAEYLITPTLKTNGFTNLGKNII